ncbi:MAG: imidazole glycerol phosphate synthase subunit HisH [Candidatus Omnitrophica bacterium]|nr:imidazole glycerol phosphate synthase subunit HisH [Candidatus Omnitrophota bacterium]
MKNIVIVDYNLGNLFNLRRAFESVGTQVAVSADPEDILAASSIILPGVGAFGEGIKHLKERGLIAPLKEFASSGKPLLGICLGMQLLMTTSEEHGTWEGLDIIKGMVKRLDPPGDGDIYKVPQVGWNSILKQFNSRGLSWNGTVLDGVDEKAYMYFLHSYYVIASDTRDILAETIYGRNRFSSIIKKNNITGCQFHPERSGEAGLKILKNFAEL